MLLFNSIVAFFCLQADLLFFSISHRQGIWLNIHELEAIISWSPIREEGASTEIKPGISLKPEYLGAALSLNKINLFMQFFRSPAMMEVMADKT